MESERNPSGPSRTLPRATPAGVAVSPSRPVPSQPIHTSTASRDAVSTTPVAHAREGAEPESIERQFVRHVYGDDCQLPYVPASREPKPRRSKGYGTPPINRVLGALLGAGCSYRPARSVDEWEARCPTHEDSKPSLVIRRNADGSVWLKCWAGCAKEQILAALGLEWRDLWDASEQDAGRSKGYVKPLLPAHLRRAMEDLIRLDDERKAA